MGPTEDQTQPPEEQAQPREGAILRLRRFLRPRARTWMFMVPLHLGAFVLLYFLTARLLEQEILTTTEDTARGQLEHAAHELHLVALARTGDSEHGHLFGALVAAHSAIDLLLYMPGGRIVGDAEQLTQNDHDDVVRFLGGGTPEQYWLASEGDLDEMRGLLRVRANPDCTACHKLGDTLAVAAMKLDLSDHLIKSRTHARQNLALIILAWAILLAVVTRLVQHSIKKSALRLEQQLAAAEEGNPEALAHRSGIFLDPVSAQIQDSLHNFLQRQEKRQKDVATRLIHTDQLASLGQLAAGLAHEIKNPLAGIQGALEIMREDIQDESTIQLCDEMLSEFDRVNETLSNLLVSARPSPPRLANSDIRQLVEDTRRLLDPGLRRQKVQLLVEIAPGKLEGRIDPAKIRQVLINLVQNAAEAMDDGGQVTVRAAPFPDTDGIIIAVEDDGPGIQQEHQAKILEPFYTTKFTGTGLGLAIAVSLIEQHGGTLEFESEPDQGTTFYLLLPGSPAQKDAEADPEHLLHE